jgi:uncharacterized membrane protein
MESPRSAASWVYLVSLGAPAVAAIVLSLHYPRLPEVIPVHFNAAGEPDGFTDKSWATVLALPAIALAIAGMFAVMEVVRRQAWGPQPRNESAERAVRVPFSESAHARAHHFLAATNRWLAWLGLIVSAGLSMLAVASLVPEYRWLFTPALVLVLLGTVVVVVVGLFLSFRAESQAKELLPPDEEELERDRLLSPADAQRQVYRLGGFFYRNPADPAVIGPSYANSGNIDINVAHPPGALFYRCVALLVGIVTVLPIVMTIL